MTKQANPFYKQKKWISKRNRILRRDEYLCRQCKRYGKVTGAYTVHHIYPLEDYPEYKLTSDNLLSLCAECHGKMHNRKTNELTELGEMWKSKILLNPPGFEK